jgi:uncharacterized protein (DUF427 family)
MPKESVWDYPRPPRLEPVTRRIRVEFAGQTIADTTRAYRVLETSHPPVYYIPPQDIRREFLQRTSGSSFCEWKGEASYWTVAVNTKRSYKAAWSYDSPTRAFQPILGYLAFYASRVDACWIDEEKVEAQPGDFYGGWITSDVVGPFKGGLGTHGW